MEGIKHDPSSPLFQHWESVGWTAAEHEECDWPLMDPGPTPLPTNDRLPRLVVTAISQPPLSNGDDARSTCLVASVSTCNARGVVQIGRLGSAGDCCELDLRDPENFSSSIDVQTMRHRRPVRAPSRAPILPRFHRTASFHGATRSLIPDARNTRL